MTEVCGYCKDTHGRHFLGCPYVGPALDRSAYEDKQNEEIAKWRSKHGYTPDLPLRTDGIHTIEECGKVPVGHEYNGVKGPASISQQRKDEPVFSGVMRYFPDAMRAIARLSKSGNDKHNPGQPLHWSRHKSDDHGDCIARHQLEFDRVDSETGEYHAVAVAWRALAQCQLLEEKKDENSPRPEVNTGASSADPNKYNVSSRTSGRTKS